MSPNSYCVASWNEIWANIVLRQKSTPVGYFLVPVYALELRNFMGFFVFVVLGTGHCELQVSVIIAQVLSSSSGESKDTLHVKWKSLVTNSPEKLQHVLNTINPNWFCPWSPFCCTSSSHPKNRVWQYEIV